MTDFAKRDLPDQSIELEVTGVTDADRIITLDDLLAKFDVDTEVFDVVAFDPNSWETHFRVGDGIHRVTNFQAKARLKKNLSVVTAERAADMFRELVKNHKANYKKVPRKLANKQQEGITVIVDLFDLHVGMLAWGEETQSDSWDSGIACQVALDAVRDLIDRLNGMNITRIVFPMGNDLLHTDATIGGSGGTTTGGTPQDVDTRYLKMFRKALQLMITLIDLLREIAPVDVVVVPGNHDRERVAYMGEAIFAWYHNDPEVTVDNSANLRKYLVIGKTLVGFTHGDGERAEHLPLIMAQERPREWGEVEYKVFHTGHLHRKRKMLSITTDTYTGVEVLTLPSLVPPDAWHSMKGYVGGGRAAEAYLYGDISGPCGYFRHSVAVKT